MILVSLTLALAPQPFFQEEPAPPPAATPVVVVYDEDVELRDSLLAAAAVHADSAGFVVAMLDPRLEAAVETRGGRVIHLPEGTEMDELWLIPLDHLELEPGTLRGADVPAELLYHRGYGAPAVFALEPGGRPALQSHIWLGVM